MADDAQRPIVIKRKKVTAGGHGGAWKIAYADFVTAMMAFFLLMWLLGSTTKSDLQGIAEYFKNPMKVSMAGGSGAGDAVTVIKGGGTDLTRQKGQVQKGALPPAPIKPKDVDLKTAEERLRLEEKARLEDLKSKLEALIESTPSLQQFRRQLLIDLTSEGLRIQIIDEQNRPMFASGRADLQPYTRVILREIAKVLNGVPNRIGLAGHTDAAAYAGGEGGYSNWELSADRANASRRELVAGGLAEGKVLRVVGLASSVAFDKSDPLAPTNRRISIVVLNKQTEDAITSEGRAVDIQGKDGLAPEQLAPPAPPKS